MSPAGRGPGTGWPHAGRRPGMGRPLPDPFGPRLECESGGPGARNGLAARGPKARDGAATAGPFRPRDFGLLSGTFG